MRQKVGLLIKVKDKVYKTVFKPTMTYGAECGAVRKKDEKILHVAEMRMLRWIRGNTIKDYFRKHNYNTRGCQSVPNVNIPERQPLKKNDGHGCTGEEKKGRPRRRWIDNNMEYVNKYELTADMIENRQYWKMMAKTGPQRCEDGL